MSTDLNNLGMLVDVGNACAVLWGADTPSHRVRMYRMIKADQIKATKFGSRKFFIPRTEIERIAGTTDSSTD
tara:strand:- start:55 stop:270 length:216 start_codon:yes stop_codon:yes gene_type:complete